MAYLTAPSRAILRQIATPSRLLRLPAAAAAAAARSTHAITYSPRPVFTSTLPASVTVSPVTVSPRRWNSSAPALTLEAPDYLNEAELKIFNMLKEELQPSKLEVQDISGGCGSMYGLDIVSEKFKGLPVIKQHRLVNKILGEEIKKWHGVQLKTKAP